MHNGDAVVIYVAGNPSLYPLEYYDSESGSYLGLIPDFLSAFAAENGYELRYIQPSGEDRRSQYAANRQVDIISGCADGETFANTGGGELTLFYAETAAGRVGATLRFTSVAPEGLRESVAAFAAGYSGEEWMGALLDSAGDVPPSAAPMPLLVGAGVVFALLAAALAAALIRIYRMKRAARDLYLTDSATGLGTEEALELAFSHLERDQARKSWCLVSFCVDLDRVGWLWGPEQAERLLLHCAGALREATGAADTTCRRGQSLLVLRRFIDGDEAKIWADAVTAKMRDFPGCRDCLAPGDITAGVCPLTEEYVDYEHAAFHARQCALAAARQRLDSRICGTSRCRRCRERWQLLEDFDHAMERHEIELSLQFFVNAHSFETVGGEALSRWKHPRLGLLNPGRYVPLLEDSGRISELDLYGLEATCALLQRLNEAGVGDFFISCNFARTTFSAPDFAARCVDIIERFSFERRLLILEITESQLIDAEDAALMLANIVRVRMHGVRVILDDFGMGFSSFHDLQDFPMDGLKLDKELVDNMDSERGGIIIKGLIDTGHRMGLTILAEGVESDGQIAELQRLNCDVLQGYRFSRPLPVEEAAARILESRRAEGKGTGGLTV